MEPKELSEEAAERTMAVLAGLCGEFWSETDLEGQEWRFGPCDLEYDHDGGHRTGAWRRVP